MGRFSTFYELIKIGVVEQWRIAEKDWWSGAFCLNHYSNTPALQEVTMNIQTLTMKDITLW
jgi:hypothetical protein